MEFPTTEIDYDGLNPISGCTTKVVQPPRHVITRSLRTSISYDLTLGRRTMIEHLYVVSVTNLGLSLIAI
jgi:hypothetical protein